MSLKSLLRTITNNPTRKIFAVIFAFGLWFFVAIDNNYQHEKEIEIYYTNLPESLIISDSITSVTVILNGRGGSLLSIWAAPPKAYCDLRNSKFGINKISTDKLYIPLGFTDISLRFKNRKAIDVTIDKRISERINVTVPIKGSLREGYSINDITVLDSVNVIGPKEILRNLDAISTETLNVKNKSFSFQKEIKLKPPTTLLHISKKIVQVKVEVDTTVERLFANIPLRLIFFPSQRVTSQKISLDSLIVSGSKHRIGELKKRDIEVSIKLSKLTPGEYNLPAEILLPEYIKPIYSKPKTFRIKIY
jgi:YbbR domain-containing protein